jgi:hypothetical protein
VDDLTGKTNSVVDIWEENGKLYGKIERLINPDPNDPDPRCVRCSGDLKNRRLVGLRIVWDLTEDAASGLAERSSTPTAERYTGAR